MILHDLTWILPVVRALIRGIVTVGAVALAVKANAPPSTIRLNEQHCLVTCNS